MRRPKVLYIFHKSLTEPIPRLHGLGQIHAMSTHREFVVVSFEPSPGTRSPEQRELYEETKAWLADAGVAHLPLPAVGSRLVEIPLGALAILRWVLFGGVRVVHCRSYIPAVMGLIVRTLLPVRLVFDMRGLFVDEYMYDGALKEGTAKLAFARWLERRLLFQSDVTIVVSHAFEEHLSTRPDLAGRLRRERVRVIPNRVDLERFAPMVGERERLRRERGWEGSVVAVFIGSVSGWHRLDRTVEVMAAVMTEVPDLTFVVAVYPRSDHATRLAEAAGVPLDRLEVVTAPVTRIPEILAASDVGLMLNENHLVRRVCAPIKFSEYMAAGLPAVASTSVGDTQAWIEGDGLGVVVDHEDVESAAGSIVRFLTSDDFRSGAARARCFGFAACEMDMSQTLEDYDAIYEELLRR